VAEYGVEFDSSKQYPRYIILPRLKDKAQATIAVRMPGRKGTGLSNPDRLIRMFATAIN